MKKVVFLLVILMAVTGAIFAQSLESIWAAITPADYVKSDDKAVWTFATTGLTIRDSNGSITIPVRDLKDLAPSSGMGVTFGYDTAAYKRTYRLVVNAMTGAITLSITRDGVALPDATLTKR